MWKNLKKSKPEINKLVRISHRPQGSGGNRNGWESTGRLLKNDAWSIKAVEGYSFDKRPTHWKLIKDK